MSEETTKFTELVSIVVSRLAKIWDKGEGDLSVEVREKDKAKVKGGEVDRV